MITHDKKSLLYCNKTISLDEQDEKTLVILTPGFPSNEADTTCLPMQQNLVRSLKLMYPQ